MPKGNFFVDSTCIDCNTCRQLAPAIFEDGGQYFFCPDPAPYPSEIRSATPGPPGLPHRFHRDPGTQRASRSSPDFPLPIEKEFFIADLIPRNPSAETAILFSIPRVTGLWIPPSFFPTWSKASRKWAA